jgi:hypothetical protein
MSARNGKRPCPFCKKDHGFTPREAIVRQARTAERLASAFRGVPAAAIARRPRPKKWSMLEILVHLRDC